MLYDLLPNIQKHPIFSGVPKEHIDKYFNAECMTVKDFSQNDVAYSSNTEKRSVAFVLDGIARVYAKASVSSGENGLLRTLHRGDIFGIANLYADHEPFPSKVIAASSVKILFIDGEVFKKFIESDTTALRNYLSLQSEKIVYLNKKLATFTAGNAEKKLSMFMLDHLEGDIFTPPCSMSELADMLQMGRASLYRSLELLAENGTIKKLNKNAYAVDINKIKEI